LGIRPDLIDTGILSKFKTAVAVQYSLIGSPVIYYGSEVGMWGGDVPHNRKAMLWSDYEPYVNESDILSKYTSYKDKLSDKIVYDEVGEKIKYEVLINEDLKAYYKKWNEIYKKYKELFLKGDFNISVVQEGLVVYERNYEDYGIVIAINGTDKKITTEYLVNKGKKYFNPFVIDNENENKIIKIEDEETSEIIDIEKKEDKNKETSVMAGAIEISVEGRDVLVLIRK
jgi:glycosidase